MKEAVAAAPPKVRFWPVTAAVRALFKVTTPVAVSTAVTVEDAATPTPVTVEPTTRLAASASETVMLLVPEAPALGT